MPAQHTPDQLAAMQAAIRRIDDMLAQPVVAAQDVDDLAETLWMGIGEVLFDRFEMADNARDISLARHPSDAALYRTMPPPVVDAACLAVAAHVMREMVAIVDAAATAHGFGIAALMNQIWTSLCERIADRYARSAIELAIHTGHRSRLAATIH